MRVDDRALLGLMEESQDLQSDALHQAKAALPELNDLGASRRSRRERSRSRVGEINDQRRSFLRNSGLTAGALATRGLFIGGFGSVLAGVVASPVAADTDTDIDILQTAASLENLAVATYEAALGLPFIKDGNATVVAFAQMTQKQHAEHGAAFNAQAEALGGEAQNQPNPMFLQAVEAAKPGLTDPLKVVELAATLEQVATDTYLNNITLLDDVRSREIFTQVMGVESQHLATLRAVAALLEAGLPDLVAVPTDLAALPAAAGSASFSGAFEETPAEFVAPPESGAVT